MFVFPNYTKTYASTIDKGLTRIHVATIRHENKPRRQFTLCDDEDFVENLVSVAEFCIRNRSHRLSLA